MSEVADAVSPAVQIFNSFGGGGDFTGGLASSIGGSKWLLWGVGGLILILLIWWFTRDKGKDDSSFDETTVLLDAQEWDYAEEVATYTAMQQFDTDPFEMLDPLSPFALLEEEELILLSDYGDGSIVLASRADLETVSEFALQEAVEDGSLTSTDLGIDTVCEIGVWPLSTLGILGVLAFRGAS